MTRLPRTVHIGLGYKIKIKIVSQHRLQEIIGDDDRYNGVWDENVNTIYIARDLKAEDKRRTYFHELIHAVNDIAARDDKTFP